MAEKSERLLDGLKIGDVLHKDVVLRELNAGDILDSTLEGERLVPTPDGFQYIASPALVDMAMTARAIARIGTYDGTVTTEMLRRLSARDLAILKAAMNQRDEATAKEISKRGRGDPPPKAD